MSRQLKAVLFDFDDTLIDWGSVTVNWRDIEAARLERVHDYVADKSPGYQASFDKLIDVYWKRTRSAWSEGRVNLRAPNMPRILLKTLRDLGGADEQLDARLVLDIYDWNAVPGTRVFPDVPPVLQLLREHGIKTGIVTNASQPMWMRDAELRTFGLIDFFPDCRISGADAGYLKPHRRIFEMALGLLGTDPEETVFVGDNPVADIGGAQALGMHAVRRVNPGSSYNGRVTKPHQTLHTFAELPAILDGWYPEWRGSGS